MIMREKKEVGFRENKSPSQRYPIKEREKNIKEREKKVGFKQRGKKLGSNKREKNEFERLSKKKINK